MVDVIGSIVIMLNRCCLPNDEGPALPPKYFFLEPPCVEAGQRDLLCSDRSQPRRTGSLRGARAELRHKWGRMRWDEWYERSRNRVWRYGGQVLSGTGTLWDAVPCCKNNQCLTPAISCVVHGRRLEERSYHSSHLTSFKLTSFYGEMSPVEMRWDEMSEMNARFGVSLWGNRFWHAVSAVLHLNEIRVHGGSNTPLVRHLTPFHRTDKDLKKRSYHGFHLTWHHLTLFHLNWTRCDWSNDGSLCSRMKLMRSELRWVRLRWGEICEMNGPALSFCVARAAIVLVLSLDWLVWWVSKLDTEQRDRRSRRMISSTKSSEIFQEVVTERAGRRKKKALTSGRTCGHFVSKNSTNSQLTSWLLLI